MKIFQVVVAVLAVAVISAEKREGKSLLGVFPFNQSGDHNHTHAAGADHDHAAGADHAHAAGADHAHEAGANQTHDATADHAHVPVVSSALEGREAKQAAGSPAEIELSIGNIAAAGERCIDKVVMVEETEYDDHIECHHSYSERCHTTYTTDFEAQQEEECEENFKKSCFIEYKKTAQEEEVKFCHTPFVCEGEGPVECKIVYQSECETRFHEHDVQDDVVDCETIQEEKCEDITQGYTTEKKCTKWPKQVCTSSKQQVKKYSPETECKKVPHELCGPSGCVPTPGPEECFPKKETVVVEVPEETCNLEPQKACKQVTKLVPSLKAAEECVDVPKEVCSRSRKNPRKVQKPVVKKWCYIPSAQSGLA